MATDKNNTDQIRRLKNTCVLAGPIAEINKFKEDKNKDGVDYLYFDGVIRCGETSESDVRFRIFSTALKVDNATGKKVDRPNFKKLRDWCRSCIAMTKSVENATWAELGGYISMNDYVNKKEKLIETIQYNISWIRPFTEYKAQIDLEGILKNIADETKGEDETPTGRKKMRIISTDIFGNAVNLLNIKAEPEIANALDEADYTENSLATYFLNLIPSKAEPVKSKPGGIGQQRTTEARSYLEFILIGANPIIEEDDENNYIEPKMFKKLMAERQIHLKEIEEGGYKGSDDNSGGSSSNNTTSSSSKSVSEEEDDDGEIPF